MALHGREAEQAAIADLLGSARAGAGATLAVLGEAGAGKSALLLDAARQAADDMTTLRTSGIESEAPLPFAALQRLLRPLMCRLDVVPAPQAKALRVAFGEEAGETGDRFLVFMGALSLLAAAAEDRPVLALVDDAHWLDEASAAALHFIARRIVVDRVALLWAARERDARRFDPADLPVLRLTGLDLGGVSAILAEETGRNVAAEVAALLLANTGGNPLAIHELASRLSPEQLTGDAPMPPRLPVTERMERVFLERARRLSRDAQILLLVASADGSARVATLLQASAVLGAGPDALAEVERSGLVTLADDQLSLRHPLVSSALYSAAPSGERRRVHAALAEVLTREADADRRAWHRSASVVEPDESVVADLVEAAERAEKRGAHEAAAAAWTRAADLSAEWSIRARHLHAAARAAWVAARPDQARELVDRAIRETDDPLLLADARRLRGRIEWNTGSVRLAHRMLFEAAADAARHDPDRAREIATEAVSIALWDSDPDTSLDATALVPQPSPDAPARQRAYGHMLVGLTHVLAGEWQEAVAPLHQAFAAYEDLPDDSEILTSLAISALHLGEFDRSEVYLDRLVTGVRTTGVVVMVLWAVTRLALTNLAAAAWADALGHATEGATLGEETGYPVLANAPRALLLLLAAHRGEDRFDVLAGRLEPAISGPAAGILDVVMRDVVHWAHGVEQWSRPASAFHRLAQMSHVMTKRMAGLDRVEAAVRAQQTEAARLWVDDLARFAAATGQAWPAAVAAHGEALLADPASAEAHFLRALELHDQAGQASRPFNRARTHLAYGEFLRRARRRVDARPHLRTALDTFEGLRARPWAERASQELRASGETVRRREDTKDAILTPQERQVAHLVRQGLSNKDVAAQLFVSPRTVDFHLRNVFAKTGVTSRVALAGLALD